MIKMVDCAKGRKGGSCLCLCHLPVELLQIILSHLSVLDYIFCRVVSKCWRSAFSLCSDQTTFPDLANNQLPWVLILRDEGENPDAVETSRNFPDPSPYYLTTTGKFGNLATGHIYTTNMIELCGTLVLLSKHGWLLLFSVQSLFFFDMFSRARISLPFLNVSGLWKPLVDISAPPTSPDCVVFIISLTMYGYEIHLCSRKHFSWTTFQFCSRINKHPLAKVTFVKGIWYCLHITGAFSTFDLANQIFKFLGKPQGMVVNKDIRVYMSYVIKHGDQVFLRFNANQQWNEVALVDPLRVTRSSNLLSVLEYYLRTNVAMLLDRVPHAVEMDSFNGNAYCVCGGSRSNDVLNFRWHRCFCYKAATEEGKRRWCPPANFECSTNVMWVQPTRIHSFSNLSWTL